MNDAISAPSDPRLNDLNATLNLLLSKVVEPAWAGRLVSDAPLDATLTEPLLLAFEHGTDGAPVKLCGPGGIGLELAGEAAGTASLAVIGAGGALPAHLAALRDAGVVQAVDDGACCCLVLDLGGRAGARLGGSGAVSPLLNASFGLSADGRVRMVRVLRLPPAQTSRQSLSRMFTSLRWPLQAPRTLSGWPRDEAWWIETSGDVKVNLGLTGGYSWSKVADLKIEALEIAASARLAAAVKVTFGFTLSGSFQLALTAGHAAGWMRVRVQRGSSRGAAFSLGLDVAAETSASGIPEDPCAVLKAGLGIDLSEFKHWIDWVAARPTLEALNQTATDAVTDAARKLVAEATDDLAARLAANDGYQKLQAAVREFKARLDDLPEEAAALVARYTGDLPSLAGRTRAVLGKLDPAAIQRTLDDADLGVLWVLFGEDLYARLADRTKADELIATLRKVLAVAESGVPEAVQQWVEEILDRTDVTRALELIDLLTSPDELKALAQTKLASLVEILVDKTWSTVSDAKALRAIYQEVSQAAARINLALVRLGELLAQARHAQASFALAASISRCTAAHAIIDVEIDLRAARADRLAEQVFTGDFSGVLDAADRRDAAVQLNACALTETREHALSVSVAALGWKRGSESKLVCALTRELVATGGGVVALCTGETTRLRTLTEETRSGTEVLQTSLLLRRLGRGDLAGPAALTGMSVDLDVTQSRKPATAGDVARVLGFAAYLGILPDAAAYARVLAEDFGDPLGEIAAVYRVSYDPDALRDAIRTVDPGEIARITIASIRAYVRARWGGAFNFDPEAAETYATYNYFPGEPFLPLDDRQQDALEDHLERRFKRVMRGPAGRRPGGPVAVGMRNVKLEWYRAELEFLRLLGSLRTELLREPSDFAALGRLSARILSIRAPWLDLYGSNVAFLILDQIIRAGRPEARQGRAALELRLTHGQSGLVSNRLLMC